MMYPGAAVADEIGTTIEPLWLTEQRTIERAIDLCDGNIPKAALLEISPSTIYRKKLTWKSQGAPRRVNPALRQSSGLCKMRVPVPNAVMALSALANVSSIFSGRPSCVPFMHMASSDAANPFSSMAPNVSRSLTSWSGLRGTSPPDARRRRPHECGRPCLRFP